MGSIPVGGAKNSQPISRLAIFATPMGQIEPISSFRLCFDFNIVTVKLDISLCEIRVLIPVGGAKNSQPISRLAIFATPMGKIEPISSFRLSIDFNIVTEKLDISLCEIRVLIPVRGAKNSQPISRLAIFACVRVDLFTFL